MANMFTGYRTRQEMPKDLRECMQTPEVANNIWNWAEKIEAFGKLLFWLLNIVCGLAAFRLIKFVWSIRKVLDLGTIGVFIFVVVIILLWAIIVSIEYFAYHGIALLMGSIASIVQSTKISANVAVFSAQGLDTKQESENIVSNTGPVVRKAVSKSDADNWVCKKCGTENPSDRRSCLSCGNSKF